MPQWRETEQRPKFILRQKVQSIMKAPEAEGHKDWYKIRMRPCVAKPGRRAIAAVWWRFLALVDYFMKQWATDTLSSHATYSEPFLLNCSLVLLLVKAGLSLKPHSTPAHISRTKSETIWRKEMGVGVLLYFLQRKPNICLCSFTGSRFLSIKTSKFPWMNLCSLESPLHLLHRNRITLNQLNAISSFPPPSSPSPYLTRVVQPW